MWVFVVTLACGCSKDNETTPVDSKSFTTDATTDFFINRDGTINIMVTGKFTDPDINSGVIRRGFVYGTTPNPEVNADNTMPAGGATNKNESATFYGLGTKQTIFIRGFFEYSNGTFFYGNEIQTTTDVEASNTRSIKMAINSKLIHENSEGILPELEVTSLEKESPVEIGYEYSLKADFSDSSITLKKIEGNVLVTSYSEYIKGLMSKTVYYFRPYAKYADGTITNGGTSAVSFLIK